MKVNSVRFFDPPVTPGATSTASILAGARAARLPLAVFPGDVPNTRAKAYAVQDGQILQNTHALVGWKVALTNPAFLAAFGAPRLVGPVFANRLIDARATGDSTISFTQFADGFCAVEAEFVAVIGSEITGLSHDVSVDAAADFVESMHIGVEIAGSPIKIINELGTFAVAADCGNNDGVILGQEIKNWRNLPLETLTARTMIEGVQVGTGSAASVPGGPMAAVAFLINCLRERGILLKKGDVISTGATTGIHVIHSGQTSMVDFGAFGRFNLKSATHA